mmetsp:Transcript_458/g.724  ORF Transcript_458/g.724 Transcript_458/m.724 type:complete len:233 (-) Transcript_458:164-862(-)
MKNYVIRSRFLGNILILLGPKSQSFITSGNRCLKLASLRFLRSILAVKDEQYHRHIIQYNLFEQVFEAFRVNPVGDNLVSSAIIEMCDFIKTENIKSLIEYIVDKHLSKHQPHTGNQASSTNQFLSLEDVATPYVDTLSQLRKKHEENQIAAKVERDGYDYISHGANSTSNPLVPSGSPIRGPRAGLSGKALEDQRKFLESDEEESYFNDEDEGLRLIRHQRPPSPVPQPGI